MSYFIKQFAEPAPTMKHFGAASHSGTMTGTRTIEGSDQDKQANTLSAFVLGTATCTESLEGSDQDKCSNFFSN